jgi:hypothetical protein
MSGKVATSHRVRQLYNAYDDVQTRHVDFFHRALFFRHTRTLILGYIYAVGRFRALRVFHHGGTEGTEMEKEFDNFFGLNASMF